MSNEVNIKEKKAKTIPRPEFINDNTRERIMSCWNSLICTLGGARESDDIGDFFDALEQKYPDIAKLADDIWLGWVLQGLITLRFAIPSCDWTDDPPVKTEDITRALELAVNYFRTTTKKPTVWSGDSGAGTVVFSWSGYFKSSLLIEIPPSDKGASTNLYISEPDVSIFIENIEDLSQKELDMIFAMHDEKTNREEATSAFINWSQSHTRKEKKLKTVATKLCFDKETRKNILTAWDEANADNVDRIRQRGAATHRLGEWMEKYADKGHYKSWVEACEDVRQEFDANCKADFDIFQKILKKNYPNIAELCEKTWLGPVFKQLVITGVNWPSIDKSHIGKGGVSVTTRMAALRMLLDILRPKTMSPSVTTGNFWDHGLLFSWAAESYPLSLRIEMPEFKYNIPYTAHVHCDTGKNSIEQWEEGSDITWLPGFSGNLEDFPDEIAAAIEALDISAGNDAQQIFCKKMRECKIERLNK